MASLLSGAFGHILDFLNIAVFCALRPVLITLSNKI